MKFSQVKFLYRLISHNQHLQDVRHPMFERNQAMKILSYVFIAFWAVYLMVLGVSFYGAYCNHAFEAYDYLNGNAIYLLLIDFLLRFTMQDTPAQNVKQYKLLPVPEDFLLNVFLARLGLRFYNFFWAFFLIPFGLLAVSHLHGYLSLLTYLIGWWLLFVINGYWYLLCRTYISRNANNILIPVVVYALLIGSGMFNTDVCYPLTGTRWLFFTMMNFMRMFIVFKPLALIPVFTILIPLFVINKRLQRVAIYTELSRSERHKTFRTGHLRCFDILGRTGEYLKLEIRSIQRNSAIRSKFINGTVVMIMLSLIFAYTSAYDQYPFMRMFICIYSFSCLGITTLTTIMCTEGNYIDGLMTNNQSIYALLKAKYYFNCAMLLVPLSIITFPVTQGKLPLTDVLACLFFTAGCIFPFLFQLAVTNTNTLTLNNKITKGGHNSKAQMVVSLTAMFIPMLLMNWLVNLYSEQTAAEIMMFIGLCGIFSHPIWLRNIYTRFMRRRYQNLSEFRNSK